MANWSQWYSQALSKGKDKLSQAGDDFVGFTNRVGPSVESFIHGATFGVASKPAVTKFTGGFGKPGRALATPTTKAEKTVSSIGRFSTEMALTHVLAKPFAAALSPATRFATAKLAPKAAGTLSTIWVKGLTSGIKGLPYTFGYATASSIGESVMKPEDKRNIGRDIGMDIGIDLAIGTLPLGFLISKIRKLAPGKGSKLLTSGVKSALGDVNFLSPESIKPVRESLENAYQDQLAGRLSKTELPILVDKAGNILDGHGRYLEALSRGDTTIPVTRNESTYRQLAEKFVEQPRDAVGRYDFKQFGFLGGKVDPEIEKVINVGRKEIGSSVRQDKRSVRKVFDDLYTHWVDRYNPVVKASQFVKKAAKSKGVSVPSFADPEYLVRRLSGAGSIADQRFKSQLDPILKQMEGLNIAKSDMDVYLANKRIAAFGRIGRDIKGADPEQATKIIDALETKYGPEIGELAEKFYKYQDEGFSEIAEAGFLSPEVALDIKAKNPDYAPLNRVMDEMDDYLGVPTRKLMQGTQPIQKIKGSEKQIISPVESIIGNTFSQRAAIEKNRVAQAIVGLNDVVDMGFKQVQKSGPDTITVWRGGQKEYWNVGKDIADTAKGVNEESMNTLLKILQAPASILRQGATGRNPEFMIPNIVRDQLDAGITSKYGYVPFVDYTRGLVEMLKNTSNRRLGTQFNDDIYKTWANSGASIDLGEMSGRKSISKLFDEKKSKKKLTKWITDVLDVSGKYSEQPTRIGLFKKAYKKTGDPLIAAMESRDATVDFARMGSKMKTANSIIPFLNVGLQGFNKLIRAVKDEPAKVLFNMGLYGAAPAAAFTLYNLRDHEEEYKEIPQYEKDNNFVLVKGRNKDGTVDYLTFPKGHMLPVASNPVQSFIEYLHGVDDQSFQEMATSVISGVLPVLGEGSTAKEVGIKTLGSNLPQAIKPITENLINKSFFKYDEGREEAREIVPSYLKNKPAYEQTYPFTPQMYQTVGKVFNVSPLQVKNMLEGYFAGYAKIPAQVIEMVYKASEGEEITPNDRTLLRRFIKQTYPSSGVKFIPKEEAEVPGLTDRLFPKAGAAEKAPEPEEAPEDREDRLVKLWKEQGGAGYVNNKIVWIDEKGRKDSIDFSKYEDGVTGLEKNSLETQKKNDARDLFKSNSTEDIKKFGFEKLGISKEDAGYDVAAHYPSDAKIGYYTDRSRTMDHDALVEELIEGRKKSISGRYLVNESTLTGLRDAGILSWDEWRSIKDIKVDSKGKVVKKSLSKKAKKPKRAKKLPTPKAKAVTFKRDLKTRKPKKITQKKYKLKEVSLEPLRLTRK